MTFCINLSPVYGLHFHGEDGLFLSYQARSRLFAGKSHVTIVDPEFLKIILVFWKLGQTPPH